MHILVTGAAGFIGFHLAKALLARGDRVHGVDCLTDYYDVSLKEARLTQLLKESAFDFSNLDLRDRGGTNAFFVNRRFDVVVHLAAQPGVRYSITHPMAYYDHNLTAFGQLLEGVRAIKPRHFLFASSSSVYGNNGKLPFHEDDPVDHPVSLYAATKKANELVAHAYAELYGISTTGLRFFTVYGPWGRPDMAIFKFTRAILAGEPIPVFNNGQLTRDYTYVDDVVTSVVALIDRPATPDSTWDRAAPRPSTSSAPYRIFNVGNHRPVQLMDFIHAIERACGKTAQIDFLPMQPGDVLATEADVSQLAAATGVTPETPIAEGVARFVQWYRGFYGVSA